MKKVTLLFENEKDLEDFVRIASIDTSRADFDHLTLICNCDEAEIELAEKAFNARIIKVETSLP